MIFVIGGSSSGKREYVKKAFGFEDTDMADAVLDGRPVLYNLQSLVAAADGPETALIPALLEKAVVICNEVGGGVVPIYKSERVWREATGRLCCELAARAEKVVRVVCGIPTVIKE